MQRRDGQCQYPGCERTRTDAHHIIHWADGGPTNLTNLPSLCSRHHHLLHEGRYTVATNPDHRPAFVRPDGQVIPAVPHLPPPGTTQPGYLDRVAPFQPNWEGQRLDLPTIIEILHQYLPKPDPTPGDSAESYEPDSAESSA
ncbi:MAG: HNH endonuclease [Actinomycetota bacterium]|nr:HNH endonuclease [Actinomycetota bacterium]